VKKIFINFIVALFLQYGFATVAFADLAVLVCTSFPARYSDEIVALKGAIEKAPNLKSVNFCESPAIEERVKDTDIPEYIGRVAHYKILPKPPEFKNHIVAFGHYSRLIKDDSIVLRMAEFWNDLSSSKSARNKEFSKYSLGSFIYGPAHNLKKTIAKGNITQLDFYIGIGTFFEPNYRISPRIFVKSEAKIWRVILKQHSDGFEIDEIYFYEDEH